MRTDLELRSLGFVDGGAEGISGPAAQPAASGEGSFSRELGQALGQVDKLQVDADKEAEKVAMGAGNMHEMAIALEKADLSMRMALKVRNKIVDAYNEIMRMTV